MDMLVVNLIFIDFCIHDVAAPNNARKETADAFMPVLLCFVAYTLPSDALFRPKGVKERVYSLADE